MCIQKSSSCICKSRNLNQAYTQMRINYKNLGLSPNTQSLECDLVYKHIQIQVPDATRPPPLYCVE